MANKELPKKKAKEFFDIDDPANYDNLNKFLLEDFDRKRRLKEFLEEMTMANIAFVPTCSKCMTPIFDKAVGITTEYADELYSSKRLCLEPHVEVHPEKCPHCGALFKHLIYPDSQHLENGKLVVFTEKLINKKGDNE